MTNERTFPYGDYLGKSQYCGKIANLFLLSLDAGRTSIFAGAISYMDRVAISVAVAIIAREMHLNAAQLGSRR